MKKVILSALTAVLVMSCATIKVTYDFDKTAQFAGYKTYQFTPEALALNIEVLNRNRLITAIENEMSLKGFTKSETPDVFVDVKITGEKKQTATATSTGGGRYGWGGGGTTTVNYNSYVEGTLFIEMVDAAKSQIVWQGRGVATLNPDASASKRESNINTAVKMIFAKYPPVTK
jgi:hypothetical protein